MNWLIITSTDTDIKEKIIACDPSAKFFCHSVDSSFENFFTLNESLESVTHCIALFNKSYTYDTACVFMLGYLIGKGIPVYTTKKASSSYIPRNVCSFESEEELITFVISNYNEIHNQYKKERARNYLFEKGFAFTEDGFSFCVSNGMLDACKQYVAGGINVNVKNWKGIPLLNTAIRKEKLEIARYLIENGADVNAISLDRGYSALMDAVWCGSEDGVRLLLDNGAKLNIINKDGQTMLILAVGAGRTEICKMLVESGEDPDIKDRMGMSAYEYARLFKKDDIADILEKFHKK